MNRKEFDVLVSQFVATGNEAGNHLSIACVLASLLVGSYDKLPKEDQNSYVELLENHISLNLVGKIRNSI
jgi:hypothetical protein